MNIELYNNEVQNWIKQIQNHRGKNPKEMLSYCDKIEDYGHKVHDDALIGFACFSKGETYYLMNDVKNFYTQMLASITPMKKIGEWGYLVMANNMLGIMSSNQGNTPFAMDYFMKAVSYCQTYKLPDLEWMIHMNIGSLYLNLNDYHKALSHLETGYHYISTHTDKLDYTSNITMVYIGMGKAYLKQGEMVKADIYSEKILRECLPDADTLNELIIYGYLSSYYQAKGDKENLLHTIGLIREKMTKDMPIMDIFDDIYEYLELLLELKMFEDFKHIFDFIEPIIEETAIKFLRKRLLTLKIHYYDKKKDELAYKEATVDFFQLSEGMEKENDLMMSNMIAMRSSLNDLAQINQEVERENMVLHRKSETDALTGLYNRQKLNDYGEEAFERAYQNQSGLAIEILDIDYFKQYNDNYGHQAGDTAIQAVANTMLSLTECGNIFCSRYGGDEFVMIYEEFDRDEVAQLSKCLQEKITELAIPHKYSKAADIITISQGICWGIPKTGNKVWDYLHAADQALYEVKKSSRNNLSITCI